MGGVVVIGVVEGENGGCFLLLYLGWYGWLEFVEGSRGIGLVGFLDLG
jgi:hypothetical protein